MKNIIKNVFGFVLGLIVTCRIGVLAVNYLYDSNDVSYNNTSVNNALNELYNIANSTKGEVIYADSAWPGTLTYTSTRDCEGKIVTFSSNWNAPEELKINLTQNNSVILTTNSRNAYQVPVTIKKGDIFKYQVVSGSPNYSHMSMTIICFN